MNYSCNYLLYKQTNYFTKIVVDYVEKENFLKEFYNTTETDLEKIIKEKQESYEQRKTLVQYFDEKYKTAHPNQTKNIELLKSHNSFSITTAHQPNIFTGPLYFIYKILHVVKIANELNSKYKQYNFVPIYYMGSEDADIDELGNTFIQHKKVKWNTQQTGSVGRMFVDKNFIELIKEIEGQIGVNTYGDELIKIFKESYILNQSIQECTFSLVNTLFGKYGLLVIVPDNALLKKSFENVVLKELQEQFSEKEVYKTVESLNKHYKIKQTGRALNLFYLIDDKRERITYENGIYEVEALNLKFNQQQIIEHLKIYPERFSYNVILRPVFQEFILPNIIFVGGGGEITYWLQLKNVFNKAKVNYPILLLRNSFLFYSKLQKEKLNKMGFNIAQIFSTKDELINNFVKNNSVKDLSTKSSQEKMKIIYEELQTQAKSIDKSLLEHIKKLAHLSQEKIINLEKKFLRAEKRNYQDQKNQLDKIYNDLFFNNSLQERVENFSYLYSVLGNSLFEIVLDSSKSFDQKFGLICIENN